MAESAMDLLVDNGFIVDENWHAVPGVVGQSGGAIECYRGRRCQASQLSGRSVWG